MPATAPTTRPATGARAGRAAQRATTRARLYEATVAEFMSQGFAATEVAVVAERVGLSRGAFYVHFAGKDEVLRELLVVEEQHIADTARAALDDTSDVAELFLAVVTAVLTAEQRLGRGLVRDLCAAQFRPEFAAQLAVEDHPLGVMLVEEVAARAPGTDPVDLTMVFLTGMFGLLAVDDSGDADRRRRLTRLIESVTSPLRDAALIRKKRRP